MGRAYNYRLLHRSNGHYPQGAVRKYAEPERVFLIDVIGFDWNCSRHITQCFTEDEIRHGTQPLLDELARLRARVAELEGMTP